MQMVQVDTMGNPVFVSFERRESQPESSADQLDFIAAVPSHLGDVGHTPMAFSGTSGTLLSATMASATTFPEATPLTAVPQGPHQMQHNAQQHYHMTTSFPSNTPPFYAQNQHPPMPMDQFRSSLSLQQSRNGPFYSNETGQPSHNGPATQTLQSGGFLGVSLGMNVSYNGDSMNPSIMVPNQQMHRVDGSTHGTPAPGISPLAAMGPAICSVIGDSSSQSSQGCQQGQHQQDMPFAQRHDSSQGHSQISPHQVGAPGQNQKHQQLHNQSQSQQQSHAELISAAGLTYQAGNSTSSVSPSGSIQLSSSSNLGKHSAGSSSVSTGTMSSSPPSTNNGTAGSTAANAGTSSSAGMPQAVAAACLACRAKHLKCDGSTPCSRCTQNQSECVYIASRRGYKGPKSRGVQGNPHKRRAETNPEELFASELPTTTGAGSYSCPMLLGQTSGVPVTISASPPGNIGIHASTSDGSSPYSRSNSASLQVIRNYDTSHLLLSPTAQAAAATAMGTGMIPAQTSVTPVKDRCLDSYYHHFFAAHPFVLPKEYLLRTAKDGLINYLLAAMRYVGSLYLNVGGAGASFFEEAKNACYNPSTPRDGFLVQAILILIIGLDGSCQREQARKMLMDAEQIAVEIQLNTRPFATLHGRGIAVLEESWRRTWWDLYVVDGMVAGVHRETNFALYDVQCDVALPCEEEQYVNGSIPQPMYLDDLENADFSGEDREFSSFAYRILSARILGCMMRQPEFFGPDDENITKIETLLTNWRLHLPASKRDAINKQLQLDEMMFQAIMMNRAISIMLHQPFSQLDSSVTRNVNSCAEHQPVACGQDFNHHTRHTISSANDISKLILHRVNLLSHTHFFTCVITLSSIVHLSKWSLYFVPHDDDDLRQKIRLNIGALTRLSHVWKAASTACGQVRGVAQEIYKSKKSQSELPGFWLGLTQEQISSSMATDESIMSEINALTSAPIITEADYVRFDS